MTPLSLIPRRIQSATIKAQSLLRTQIVYFKSKFNINIKLGPHCNFEYNVILRATDGGSIHIGSGTSIGRGAKVISHGGQLSIGDDVYIGDGSIIVCRDKIHLGSDSLVAEYVVIRDQDHETSTRPIRSAGFKSSPIQIGRDVWIGCKATILRGVTVGDGAVVGAHALVRSDVPAGKLAVGVPAHVVGPVGGSA